MRAESGQLPNIAGRARLLNLTACTAFPPPSPPPPQPQRLQHQWRRQSQAPPRGRALTTVNTSAPLFDIDAVNLGGKYVQLGEAEKYKYHACVEGAGFWADRLPRMLFSGSVLFLQRYAASCDDWFMMAARPWVHFVPLRADFSDLHTTVLWARDHDNEMRRIRTAQNAFGATYINRKAIMEYLATLIHCYAPLLRPTPQGSAWGVPLALTTLRTLK